MTVILADLPDSTTDDVSDRLHQIIAAINGFAGQGIQFNLTEYNDDAKYGLQTRNKGAGGLHFAAYLSSADITTDDPIVAITDAGLALSGGLTVGGNLDVTGTTTLHNILTVAGATTLNNGLTVHGNDIVTDQDIAADGDIAAGGTLFADATGRAHGLDVIGGAIISGAITLNGTIHGTTTAQIDGALTGSSTIQGTQLISTVSTGTAPLVVASQTQVSNLNASLLNGKQPGTSVGEIAFYNSNDRVVDSEKLEGHSASFFATASSLGSYVQKSGDTMTGVLTMEPSSGNDQVIKLKHDSSSGGVYLGSSNSINPDVIIKNNAGNQIASITSAGLFLAGDQTSPVGVAGSSSGNVQTYAVWIRDSSNNVRYIKLNGNQLQISDNATSGGTPGGIDMTIGATAHHVAVQYLDVDHDIDAGGHISGNQVTAGSSGFDTTGTISAHTVTSGSGGISTTGTISVDNGINVNGGGISVASSGISVNGTSYFANQVQFGDPPMLDTGSGAGFSRSSWGGFFSIKDSGGTTQRVPYF